MIELTKGTIARTAIMLAKSSVTCKNLLRPRGYSEEENGLQHFSSRAATMTTDV